MNSESDIQSVPTAATANAAKPRGSRADARLRALIVAIFGGAGVMHFTHESFYTPTVPDALPNPKQIVYISGVAELMGAIGVLIPRTRRLAGKGLLALLIAVFPANINMAVNSDRFKQFPVWGLWARLPLQFVVMRWVWRATQQRA
ncbi:MAG: DoxX family protein [Actinobacteria bacterium]|nr:DoxX family protein [Actinomycetota bacterium]